MGTLTAMDLSELRAAYTGDGIDRSDLADDPIDQFGVWFEQVRSSDLWEPNAMVVATVDAEGNPAARNDIAQGFRRRRLRLPYTNYGSAKAQAIDATGTCGADLQLDRASAPGAHPWPRRPRVDRGVRRVLRLPPARQPDRCLVITAELTG